MLTVQDYDNLLKLLQRVTINGLTEAEYIVVLSRRIIATRDALANPVAVAIEDNKE